MPHFDLALEELRRYKPDVAVPDDLDQFWKATLAAAREHELAARLAGVDTGMVAVETDDVSLAGCGGARVKGWLHLPAQRTGRLPAVVEYVGYGGGRGLAHERLFWSAAGYAHLIMDTRGQGSAWSVGDTPDTDGAAPAHPGYLTRRILDPETYYYPRGATPPPRAPPAGGAPPPPPPR